MPTDPKTLAKQRQAMIDWAKQEKADIESGAKKVPMTSSERAMADKDLGVIKDAGRGREWGQWPWTREGAKSTREFHTGFKDLGPKPGNEPQGRLGQRARAERARAISSSVREGRSSVTPSAAEPVRAPRNVARMTDVPGEMTGILKKSPAQSVDPIRVGTKVIRSAGQPGSLYSEEGGKMVREGLSKLTTPKPIPAGTVKPKAPKMTLRQRLKAANFDYKPGYEPRTKGGATTGPEAVTLPETHAFGDSTFERDYKDLHEEMRKINDPLK